MCHIRSTSACEKGRGCRGGFLFDARYILTAAGREEIFGYVHLEEDVRILQNDIRILPEDIRTLQNDLRIQTHDLRTLQNDLRIQVTRSVPRPPFLAPDSFNLRILEFLMIYDSG